MQVLYVLIVFLLCSVMAIKALMSIKRLRYSLLHGCVLIFYIMQVLPLFVHLFNDIRVFKFYYPYLYYAMADDSVAYVYGLFCLLAMMIMNYQGDKNAPYRQEINIRNIVISFGKLKLLFGFLMFVPIIAVLVAPTPQIYLKFSYFYTNTYNDFDVEYLYHSMILLYLLYVSFLSLILFYLGKGKSTVSSLYVYFILIIDTWIDGKRTLTIFVLLAILMIDFIKIQNQKDRKLVFKKVFVFAAIVLMYFVVYGQITQKGTDISTYEKYRAYFTREGETKLAIYSRLTGAKMVEYDGQSLLYNLTFYVPRIFWENKPYGFFNNLTSYAFCGNGNDFIVGSNFQVNVWSEFIANFGVVWGTILALALICFIAKSSESSQSLMMNLFGSVFVILYLMYGFENIVMITFFCWVVCFVKDLWKRRKRRKSRKKCMFN